MPKTSAIQKNEKRKKLAEKYGKIRAELKAVLANPATTDEQFFAAQVKLQKLPKNSAKERIRNRCSMSGRPRGYKRKFGVSRIQFRELALAGKIPGVIKSSW
jgi:small subunit ribosomal protein S14